MIVLCGFAVAIHPREGTETFNKYLERHFGKLQFIPARGRKLVVCSDTSPAEGLSCNSSPRGDKNLYNMTNCDMMVPDSCLFQRWNGSIHERRRHNFPVVSAGSGTGMRCSQFGRWFLESANPAGNLWRLASRRWQAGLSRRRGCRWTSWAR